MMRSSLRAWSSGIVLGALAAGPALHAGETGFDLVKELRIPKLTQAPVLDGQIDDREWSGAFRLTGCYRNYFGRRLVPDFLQPTWWLAFDDSYLYIAQRWAQWPDGTYFYALSKQGEVHGMYDQQLIFDDHVEIEISPFPDNPPHALSRFYYRFDINPAGAVADRRPQEAIGQPGCEWNPEAVLKHRVTAQTWEFELAVPLAALELPAKQGKRECLLQLVSTSGSGDHYFALNPVAYTDWSRFARAILDPDAVAVQIEKTGQLMAGELDLGILLSNHSRQPHTLTVEAAVTDQDTNALFSKSETVPLRKGEQRRLNWREAALAVTDQNTVSARADEWAVFPVNTFALAVRDAQGRSYFEAGLGFVKLTDEYQARSLAPISAKRRRPLPRLEFAYYPYTEAMAAWADVDLLGIEERYRAASAFHVTLQHNGHRYLELSAPVREGLASARGSLRAPLPAGDAAVTLALLSPAGDALCSRTQTLTRASFPFEHNLLGTEPVLVSPFTPVRVEGTTVGVWGRQYELASNGLPRRISSPYGEILRAPVSVEGRVNGKTCSLASGSPLTFTGKSDAEACLVAGGRLGDLPVTVGATAEYDGLYRITLELLPQGRTALDAMTLVIPFERFCDLLVASAQSYEEVKAIPLTKGVVWSSRDGPRDTSGSDFMPLVFVGNGDCGLYWCADSAQGMRLDESKPFLELIRNAGGALDLRVRLIGKPLTFAQPRVLTFALMATPVKPKWQGWRLRVLNGLGGGSGGSWWGSIRGLFCLPQTPKELAAYGAHRDNLRRRLNMGFHPEALKKTFPYSVTEEFVAQVQANPKDYFHGWFGDYHSCFVGYLLPEMGTYAGEWTGRSSPARMWIETSRLRKEGPWTTNDQVTCFGADLCPSYIDYEVYTYYRMARELGFSGYWWDMRLYYPGHLHTGGQWIDEDGVTRPNYNLFRARSLYRRMATVNQVLGVPSTHSHYSHAPMPVASFFNTLCAVEGVFYASDPDYDFLDVCDLAKFRALLGTFKGLPTRWHALLPDIRKHPHNLRCHLGLALLHDVAATYPYYLGDLVGRLDRFGFFLDSTACHPYWRDGVPIRADREPLLVTVYTGREGRAAGKRLAVVFNAGEKDAAATLTVESVEQPLQVLDLETDSAVGRLTPQDTAIRSLAVARHEFRLLQLAPE